MWLKSSSEPPGIINVVPGLQNAYREAGGTQNNSRHFGPTTHPLSTSRTKGVEMQWSSNASSVDPEMLHSAWMELDEKEMKSLFQMFNAMVVVASIMRCSAENATMQAPSGENETELTEPVYPRKGPPIDCLVAATHSRTVSSSEPVTMRVPSGKNEAELIE
ncbi:hypothetical protein BDR04DRAFT_1160369 [Suillus decipiens]|nr:hypothetical protein BDR04DRAFT_1160369 [Suillus decipiens]